MKIRLKFVAEEVTQHANGRTVKLRPVAAKPDDAKHENKKAWPGTPGGLLALDVVDDKFGAQFTAGQVYNVDISPDTAA